MKLKGSFVSFGSKGISNIIKNTVDPQIVQNLLAVVSGDIIEQMLI